MVVIENECLLVSRINRAADARVSRAEITVSDIRWQRWRALFHRAATPRAILPVCGDDDPLFSQRMPTLFPRHSYPDYLGLSSTTVAELFRGMVNASRSLRKLRRGA